MMVDWNFITLAIMLISVLLWIRWRRPLEYPPGPTPMPIIGNLHNLAGTDILQTFRDLRTKYGDVFSLSLGQFWVVVVNGRHNLKELLVKRGDQTTARPPLFSVNAAKNKGINSSSGMEWLHQRTFAISKLRDLGFGKQSLETRIQGELEMFLNLITSFDGKPFDIEPFLSNSISNNIMTLNIGRRFDYNDSKFTHFIKLLHEMAGNKAFSGPVNFIPILAKLPGDMFGTKEVVSILETLLGFFRDEVKAHKETLDENDIRDFTDCYLIKMKEEDSKNLFTEEQLVVCLLDLFGAGTETTSVTIRWALLYILLNPDIQMKMRKEIEDVIGFGRLPTMSDKHRMPYCEAVTLESLRIGNVVPLSLPHHVTEDIYYNGFKIPKNAVLIPNLDSVANDEILFPKSQEFNPQRFLDSDGNLVDQDKIMTFSAGKRVCVGEQLARMEIFLYLTGIIQRFVIKLPDGENAPSVKGQLGLTYSPLPFKFKALSQY